MDSYLTIEDTENVLHKDKASKFIGFAYHVRNENEIKQKLEQVKQLHPKATHHCYAYRLGSDKNNYRANDGGEPGGTAGKPILGQLDSFGLSNCLLIVVRYFGGSKLGVPGLIAAYKETARETLSAAKITEQRILDHYRIRCGYTEVNRIYQTVHNLHASIIEQDLGNVSNFVIALEQIQSAALEKILKEEQIEFEFLERK